MPVSSAVLVGMADIHVLKSEGQFTCLGLGSCIGLAMLDPVAKVAGMVHIMLPEAFAGKPVEKPGKFADTGIKELLALLEKSGATKSRLKICYTGGAQVFKFGADTTSKMDIGARNAIAVEEHMKTLGFRALATDVGGNLGRTMTLNLETGIVTVRTVSSGERILCTLK